jgi:hypothetical protein
MKHLNGIPQRVLLIMKKKRCRKMMNMFVKFVVKSLLTEKMNKEILNVRYIRIVRMFCMKAI